MAGLAPRAGSDAAEREEAPTRSPAPDRLALRVAARDVAREVRASFTARLLLPAAPLPRERLERYADEALQVFGDLLDNELALTLSYRFGGDSLALERTRTDICGSPLCDQLRVSIHSARGTIFRTSLPGVRAVFPSGARGYGGASLAPEVERLYDLILSPTLPWTDGQGAPGTDIASTAWVCRGMRKTRTGWKMGG